MASAEDVTKWLRHLLHNVHAKGNDSGINAFIGDAFQHWVSVPGDHHDGALFHDSEVALGYGMGWYSSTYRGLKRLKFSGRLYAYSSQIWLFPDSMSAVFVAMNGPGTDRGQRALEGIMYHISDITLQKPAWMVTDKACCCLNEDYDHDDLKDETAPGEFKLVKYLSPVENYIGDYGNGLVGNLNIEPNKSGILILKLGRNLMGELTPGVTESKLKFSVTSPLENTEEWCDEKTIEFLLSRPHAEGVGHSELYDKVRIYIKDHLFYEFNRGKAFEAMLSLAEEEDRKLREEAETLLINNSHNEERSKNASNVYETEYPYEEDNDSVKDGGHNHEANHSVQDSHQLPDASSPDIGEDEIKSGASGPIDTAKEVSHDGHQSHKFLSVEGQGDEPVKEDAKDLAKTTESGQKERDKQDPTSNPGNACSSFNPFPVFIFIMLLLNSCF